MEFKKIKGIIERYLKGNHGIIEQQAVDQWLNSLRGKQLPHKSEKLESIRHDIWQHVEYQYEYLSRRRTSRKRLLWRSVCSVAATFLIGFILFKYIRVDHDIRYSTGPDETREISLSDGSSIILRENAELLVSKQFETDSIRLVELYKGEAFFRVKKDASRPFVVKNELMKTEVLGTSFTIRTHDVLGTWNIHVKTGQVRVSTMEKDSQHYTLLANDSLSFDQKKNNIHYMHFADLPRGKLIFEEESLQKVVQKLAKQYDRNIQVTEEIGRAHQFSGEFDADEPFASVLEIICIATGTQYQLQEDTIILFKK